MQFNYNVVPCTLITRESIAQWAFQEAGMNRDLVAVFFSYRQQGGVKDGEVFPDFGFPVLPNFFLPHSLQRSSPEGSCEVILKSRPRIEMPAHISVVEAHSIARIAYNAAVQWAKSHMEEAPDWNGINQKAAVTLVTDRYHLHVSLPPGEKREKVIRNDLFKALSGGRFLAAFLSIADALIVSSKAAESGFTEYFLDNFYSV